LSETVDSCILISAGAEWRAFLPFFPQVTLEDTPYGECFAAEINHRKITFLHGGWGKVAAAGSTQYAIDRWHPARIINLGTCGGFSGRIERGAIILANKTLIYDIFEQMTDAQRALDHYSVTMNLSWLPSPPPQPVWVRTLISADRDILPEDIPNLIDTFDASAADWESGAIAWIAHKNGVPCMVLRAVSDLVDTNKGEAYGQYTFFEQECHRIMRNFALVLPDWLTAFSTLNPSIE
jgi:adenosylhomocysteine nucleosidase